MQVAAIAAAVALGQPLHAGKQELRSLTGWLADLTLAGATTASMPAGITVMQGDGFSAVACDASAPHRLRLVTWPDQAGLLPIVQRLRAGGRNVHAAINGTFYQRSEPLGPVIVAGRPALDLVQQKSPFKYSRCCVFTAVLPDGSTQTFLGETRLCAEQLAARPLAELVRAGGLVVPQAIPGGARLVDLLGGGGWIVRNGTDVHMEAYQRQNLRFRREDQDSRHTVVALTRNGGFRLAVFREGQNLEQIATRLRAGVLGEIASAIFLDGGSSSCLVDASQYIVPPMYFIDRARFTALVLE